MATGAGNRFDLEQAETNMGELTAQLAQARAAEAEAREKLSGRIDGELSSVAEVKAQIATAYAQVKVSEAQVENTRATLANAQWELSQTTMLAPGNGTMVNVMLRPGFFVSGMPFNEVMTFVDEEYQIFAMFNQNELHQVEAGNEAGDHAGHLSGPRHQGPRRFDHLGPGQDRSRRPAICRRPPLVPPPGRFPVKLEVAKADSALFLAAGAWRDGHLHRASHAGAHHPRCCCGCRRTRLRHHQTQHQPGALMRAMPDICLDSRAPANDSGGEDRPGVVRAIHSGVVLAALSACALLAAAGCALKSPPDRASIQAKALTAAVVPPQWTAAALSSGTMSDNWLAGFHDDQLSVLVADAIIHNADLRVAAARVEQAILYAKLAGASLYPSVDLLAKGGGKMSGDGSGLSGAVLNASWELDLWGRVRYGRAAAKADALAAAADFEYARQSIAALVARSWFLAIEAGLQAEIARGALRDNQALVRLAEDRARIGVGNEEDVFAARASLGTYEDALRQIELSREQAIRALEILVGRYPAAALTLATTLPTTPETMPAGLPSELLERRPDVIAAERRVAAAFNRIGEAKAARLPKISLTVGVSSISSDLVVLKEQDNPIWNFGAGLVAPIYKGGGSRPRSRSGPEQKQAIAAYASVGLRAFGEVENALASELAARDREKILARTLSDSRRALQIVQSQYKVGSTDLRFVTQRQLALNSTQSALIRAQSEQRVQRVNLHLALGGSFEARTPPPAAPATPPPPPADAGSAQR